MHEELIAALEKATNADRWLDAQIAIAFGGIVHFLNGQPVITVDHYEWQPVPAFTASIDAALTLIGDFTDLELRGPFEDFVVWGAYFTMPDGRMIEGIGATKELAICSAGVALKARGGEAG